MYLGGEREQAPAMPSGCEGIWRAFWHLESARAVRVIGIGTAAGTLIESIPIGIPFQAVDAYARRFGIAGMEFDRFHRLISEMDHEYLNVQIEKLNERSKK